MEICMPLAAVLLMIFFVSSSALIQKTLSTLYETFHFYHHHRLLKLSPSLSLDLYFNSDFYSCTSEMPIWPKREKRTLTISFCFYTFALFMFARKELTLRG